MNQTVIHDATPTSVTEDLVQLDQTFDDARARRAMVAKVLETQIQELKMDFREPRQAEVQLQLVNTYLGLLKDNEAGVSRRVNAKLRKSDADSQNKYSASVAELLAKVSSGQMIFNVGVTSTDVSDHSSKIEQAFERHKLDPVSETELRMDPKDVGV